MVDKKIVVCVTGGIAAYKAASLVSALKNMGNEVQVIMTKNATEFITPLTFKTLSKREVIVDMFDKNSEAEIVDHIYYGQECDIIIVAPTTANCIGKVANGIADDEVTSTIIAANKPILFVPAMNTVMYDNPIVQGNIEKLKGYGYHIMEPDVGKLACEVTGKGKMPKTSSIISKADEILSNGKENE